MKTIIPFCNLEELKNLIDTRVDEFYCGVLEDNWTNKYTISYSANKRAKRDNSLLSFDELKEAYEIIKSRNKKLYLIFNNFYVQYQKEDVLKMYEKAKKIGIQNFIITDLFMLHKIKKDNLNPILSCTTPVLNKQAAKFFKSQGVTKIILPRDLNLQQIEEITTNVDLDYELIILNEACPNIDGLCRFFHGEKKDKSMVTHACDINFDIKFKTILEGKAKDQSLISIKKNLAYTKYANSCGVCSIADFSKMNINYLKIPSRGHEIKSKIRDVNFIHDAIEKRYDFQTKEEYKKFIRELYKKHYGYECNQRCYYD